MFPGYGTKQSDGKAQVMLELWGMQSSLSLPSLSFPLRPGVLAPDKVLSMGQIELNSILMLNWSFWKRNVLTFKLRTYVWNRTVYMYKNGFGIELPTTIDMP